MGIPGLFKELGPGERISLSKLAVTHLKQTSRPLRIAIDISIWLFKAQAGRGGTNPEVRTLFFRLLKLLMLPVHPLFVFDGEHKPPFKRGKAVGQGKGGSSSTLSLRLSKRLIDLFAFPRHTAPGEAEAECARLQVAGVVDAAMSDDVDTIMFGSKTTIMNFSREDSRRTDAATHVNLYRTDESQYRQERNVSLGRAEMILFAMLSGGDYLPSGVPGCGHKTAAEISRAGFGSDLLKAINEKVNPEMKLTEWRERLQHELNDNESGFFQRKHRSIKIPKTFPDRTVLSYYTDPVVSTAEKIEKLRENLKWDQDIDVLELQRFVDNTLGWTSLSGLKRFIKVFSGPLVSYRLRLKIPVLGRGETEMANKDHHSMEKVYRARALFANDAIPELQFGFVPGDVVGLKLDTEICNSSQQQDSRESSMDQDLDSELDAEDHPPTSSNPQPKEYDPFRPEKIWIFETVAEIGASEAVATWRLEQERKEFALNEAKTKKAERAAARAKKKKPLESGMKQGEIFRYASLIKPGVQPEQSSNKASSPGCTLPSSSRTSIPRSPQPNRKLTSKSSKPGPNPSTRTKKPPALLSSPKVDKTINPFTIAKSQARSRDNIASGDSQFGTGAQDAFSSASNAARKDRIADDDPFPPWSSPPPLPPISNASSRNEASTTGTTTDPITISSSPPPSEVPVASSPHFNQISTKDLEPQIPPSEYRSDPQTPPISSDLLFEEFPFSSPSNILTPTPKPKTKPPRTKPPSTPPQPRGLFGLNKKRDEDDSSSPNCDQASDPFTSSSPLTDIPQSSPPPRGNKPSTTILKPPSFPLENQTSTKPPSDRSKSAYYVDSYDGYWTCKKHEAPDTDTDTDTQNPDSVTASSSGNCGHNGKEKSPRKKYGRVSILDLT